MHGLVLRHRSPIDRDQLRTRQFGSDVFKGISEIFSCGNDSNGDSDGLSSSADFCDGFLRVGGWNPDGVFYS